VLAVLEQRRGAGLTILFQETNQLPKQKPVSLLPLLTILFIFSYGMLTYLVIQQARTIDTQRGLIRTLLGDSVELSSMKGKAARAQAQSQAQSEAQTRPQPSVQTQPETAKPKTGAVRKDPQVNRRHAPERPSKNTGVVLDTRRVMFTL